MTDLDPKIPVPYALSMVSGNQSELARKLGVKRAAINEHVLSGREFLPPLLGHRFVTVYGEPEPESMSE